MGCQFLDELIYSSLTVAKICMAKICMAKICMAVDDNYGH